MRKIRFVPIFFLPILLLSCVFFLYVGQTAYACSCEQGCNHLVGNQEQMMQCLTACSQNEFSRNASGGSGTQSLSGGPCLDCIELYYVRLLRCIRYGKDTDQYKACEENVYTAHVQCMTAAGCAGAGS